MTEPVSLEVNSRWTSVRASRAAGEFSRLTVKIELMHLRPGTSIWRASVQRRPSYTVS